MQNFKQKSVVPDHFAMIPDAEIPRSRFDVQQAVKTTFDSGYLVPIYVDEVLPGDEFNLDLTAFARLATPLYPTMDNLHLETFFFFVPNRLVWTNWVRLMGEQDNPSSSIDYTIPQITSPAGGYAVNSLEDYLGLPTVGQVTPGLTVTHSAMFQRAYNLIWNEWFRDENLQNPVVEVNNDGPDAPNIYNLLKRGKRKDYFTGALPWPQKGNAATLPLGISAPVFGNGKALGLTDGASSYGLRSAASISGAVSAATGSYNAAVGAAASGVTTNNVALGVVTSGVSGLYADLSTATAATINQLRTSFAVQRLLERDARGGTRYTEIVRSHFGVQSPDSRLQRPEYLGGGKTPVIFNPIAQGSGTGASGTSTPLGQLGAMATGLVQGHRFRSAFVEHGVILGLACVRADLSYQQGLHKMFSRKTRYDFYFPAFAHLGEQAILNKEIYVTGNAAQDDSVFGYQERWAEYRYKPSRITGLFRSTSVGTLDGWHLSQKFTSLPALNSTFITEAPPVDRILAVSSQVGKQFLFDGFFQIRMTRPLPMYSVPGMIDHF